MNVSEQTPDKLRKAAQEALDTLVRINEWLKIRSGGTGLMPDELNTIASLRDALEIKQPGDVLQIAEALREVGLTLTRTEKGYRVISLGTVSGH